MRGALFGLMAPALCGCYSMGRYDVPATMPAGKASLALAFEAGRVSEQRDDPRFGAIADKHEHLALWPLVTGRYAVIDGLEVGGTLGPTRMTAETKVRLADGLSIAPGGGLLGDVLLGDVPVLVGVDLHERVSVVAAPGLAYAHGVGKGDWVRPDGLFVRAGGGVRVRVVGPMWLMPEVTTMATVSEPLVNWTQVGLAIGAGPVP